MEAEKESNYKEGTEPLDKNNFLTGETTTHDFSTLETQIDHNSKIICRHGAKPNNNWRKGDLFDRARNAICQVWNKNKTKSAFQKVECLLCQQANGQVRVYENNLETAGPSTCWMQKWRALKKKGIQKPDPQKQFLTDLSNLLEEFQDKDNEIVLSLDANEDVIDAGPSQKFIEDVDPVDAYKNLHPDSHPTTYLQG
eukprot:1187460-Ditylum_brightwellii.AAC.1